MMMMMMMMMMMTMMMMIPQISTVDHEGWTPLMCAALRGHLGIAH
jgi:hypothetical protein